MGEHGNKCEVWVLKKLLYFFHNPQLEMHFYNCGFSSWAVGGHCCSFATDSKTRRYNFLPSANGFRSLSLHLRAVVGSRLDRDDLSMQIGDSSSLKVVLDGEHTTVNLHNCNRLNENTTVTQLDPL